MWSNLVRMDYSPPASENQSLSIRMAPQSLRDSFISQQASLPATEVAILEPHVCLFLSGPNYDEFIRTVWPRCEFLTCGEPPLRQLAKVIDQALPAASFRTYHPKYLRQGKHWSFIETIRQLVYEE